VTLDVDMASDEHWALALCCAFATRQMLRLGCDLDRLALERSLDHLSVQCPGAERPLHRLHQPGLWRRRQ